MADRAGIGYPIIQVAPHERILIRKVIQPCALSLDLNCADRLLGIFRCLALAVLGQLICSHLYSRFYDAGLRTREKVLLRCLLISSGDCGVPSCLHHRLLFYLPPVQIQLGAWSRRAPALRQPQNEIPSQRHLQPRLGCWNPHSPHADALDFTYEHTQEVCD